MPKTTLAVLTLSIAFCGSSTALSAPLRCTSDAGTITLSSAGDRITIHLAPLNQQTQTKTLPIKSADFILWDGFGRYQWTYLDFTLGNQTYSVSSSFDTAYPNSDWEVSFSVEDELHPCTEKYLTDPFNDFIELKRDAGQCWNLENQKWEGNCKNDK